MKRLSKPMKHYDLLLIFCLSWLAVMADSATIPTSLPGCPAKCGNVSIPYPFGIGKGCYLEGFEVVCEQSRPSLVNVSSLHDFEVGEIHVHEGELSVLLDPDVMCCKPESTPVYLERRIFAFSHPRRPYVFSTHNKFVAIGCNTIAYLHDNASEIFQAYFSHRNLAGLSNFQTGCASFYKSRDYIRNGTCSGIGCCQIPFLNDFLTFYWQVDRLHENTTLEFSPCSFAYMVDEALFTFTTSLFDTLMDRGRSFMNRSNTSDAALFPRFPVALEWKVGNQTCKEASSNAKEFACVADHSSCNDSTKSGGEGYRCMCDSGFEGNPYLRHGCQDIDECAKLDNPCIICANTPGSYYCTCPKGLHGDGRREGSGCRPPVLHLVPAILIGVGTGTGFLILVAITFFIIRKWKDKKAIRVKEMHFQRNQGLLLQQIISSDESATNKTKIFSLEELEKATNHFDRSGTLGGGGHGTVYKGILSDQRVVAIKKAKVSEQSEIEQFINEVAILSQINHRNVVRLYGCCLETEVPLLVYEFISNGTLFDHLHAQDMNFSLSWEDRLRIASEAAAALAYLHSAASISIFHRDVKSSNILLDDSYTAKVSDFGASRSIPLNRTCITTIVQGTFGYLDPEYFQTSQLTEKSDVYSFGVILVELLTGEKPVCLTRVQDMNLVTRFLSSIKNNKFFQIIECKLLKETTEEEIKEVAQLAETCLRLRGEERPSMKEVQATLDGLRRTKKQNHPRATQDMEEHTPLLNVPTEVSQLPVSRQFSLERAMELSMRYAR